MLAKCQREVTVFTLARFLPRALPLLVVVAMMPAPVPAAAWAAPPSLNNESFTGGATLDTTGCVLGSTFTFNVSGTATGAYPGPYSENGSVTITGISPTGFTASFTISATSGPQSGDTVVGMKMWAPPAGTVAICVDGLAVSVNSTYSAIITLPSAERFCDVGTAVTNIGLGLPGTFTESFTSSLVTATRMGPTSTCP
jgi:hypothetical protein